ncbi:MAG: YhdP family protein [Dokdonella sp.]
MTTLFRRLRLRVWKVFASLVILLAMLVGVVQLALPWLVANPARVEAWLSERLQRPVSIGHIDATWVRGGPQLTLDDVTIASAANGVPPLKLGRAELALNLFAPFQRNRGWTEFRLVGLDLGLVRQGDGTWQVHGFDTSGDQGGSDALGGLGMLVLKDLRVSVDDTARNLHLNLSASELRLIHNGNRLHVLGKVRTGDADSLPLDVIAKFDSGSASGELYVGGHNIDVAGLLAGQSIIGVGLVQGTGDIQIWAWWQSGQITDLRSRVALSDVTMGSSDTIAVSDGIDVAPRTHVDAMAWTSRWQRKDAGWLLDIADLKTSRGSDSNGPARITIERGAAGADSLRAGLDVLALQPVASIVALSNATPVGLRSWLYSANPQGTLRDTKFDWIDIGNYNVIAHWDGLGFNPSGTIPGLDLDSPAAHGELQGDAEALLLSLPDQPLRIDLPKVFRKPLVYSSIGGDFLLSRSEEAWRVETDRLGFTGEGYAGELRGGFELPTGSRPIVDLYASVSHADVPAAHLFWPISSMAKPLIDWLDQALIAGQVTSARTLIHGDLANWPFHDRSGRFEAQADIADTTFSYLSDWPRVEHLAARASFVNDSLQVHAETADTLGNTIVDADAGIAEFGDPATLVVTAKLHGRGADMLRFVRASPVGTRFADAIGGLAVTGTGDATLALTLPFRKVDDLTIDGGVKLAAAEITEPRWRLHFADANGQVRFNKGGIATDALAVQMDGHPATLALAVGDYVADSSHAIEASLHADLPITAVFTGMPEIAPLLASFPGHSPWTIAAAIDASEGDAVGRTRLTLSSDLRGTAIALPAPLDKAADAARPVRMALDMPYEGKPFSLIMGSAADGNLLALNGRLPTGDRPFAGHITFGTDEAAAPPAEGIVVDGRAGNVDAIGWIGFAAARAGGDGDTLLRDVDMTIDDLQVSDRHLPNIGLRLTPGAQTTEIALTGDSLQGVVSLPSAGLQQAGITARFQRLHWPEGTAEEATPVGSGLQPDHLPPLHIAIDDLKIGSAVFGDTHWESRPSANAMTIESFVSKSPAMGLHASGNWSGNALENRTDMVIDLTAPNLGQMLAGFGFAGIIEGGATAVKIDGRWSGPPTAFALQALDGNLAATVGEGRVLDVEPGAGRIFGLLSFAEIPRRLSLDFSDLFKSGFAFNSITGTFKLQDGNATTDDLDIKGPAADIAITGRTGIKAKDYDQNMAVTPHAGVTLPIVGAIAGGPIGAAAGLVMQGLFRKQINSVARARYHVTGTWEKPVTTLISREKASSVPAAPSPETSAQEPAAEATEPPADKPHEQ